MIHILILFLWNVFCLSSKTKTNAVEKQKQQKHNNDNNKRLVRVFVDAIEIHVRLKPSHICNGLDHVQGNQFSARES